MRPVVPAILVGLLLPVWSNPSFAADPPVTPHLRELSQTPADDPVAATPTKVEPGRYRFYSVAGYAGEVTWEVDGSSVAFKEVVKPLVMFGVVHGAKEPGEYDVPAQAIIVWGRSEGTTTVKALGIVNGKAKTLFRKVFVVGKMPQPPPDPKPDPDVDPKPDDPKPKPTVESFRVIIGFESGVVVPPNVISVAHGKLVEEWLNANCTGGKAGWRRRDQNLTSENDPKMASLWKAVKDAKPATPFFAVEVNGKVEVIPFEATPETMIAKLNTYRGTK